MFSCMRRPLAGLVVIATLVTCRTAPADDAPGDKLPLLARVTGARARVVVRGEVTKRDEKKVVDLVNQVIDDVERRFANTKHAPDPVVTLLVFSDPARYHEVAAATGDVPSDWGFYLPSRRLAIANVGVSIGNLRHELVHPLLGDDFPQIPAWLNEGIAALYGSAAHDKRGFTFVVNYRLRDLQRALRDGTLPSLADLARSTYVDVHGPRGMVYYAYARYVLLYVERRGKLGELYAELRANPTDGAKILPRYVDERAFRAWAKSLRY